MPWRHGLRGTEETCAGYGAQGRKVWAGQEDRPGGSGPRDDPASNSGLAISCGPLPDWNPLLRL